MEMKIHLIVGYQEQLTGSPLEGSPHCSQTHSWTSCSRWRTSSEKDPDYFRLFVVTSYSDVSVSFFNRHPLLSGDIALTAGFDSVTLPLNQHFQWIIATFRYLSINGNGSLLSRPNKDPLLVHLWELTGVVQQHLKQPLLVFHWGFATPSNPCRIWNPPHTCPCQYPQLICRTMINTLTHHRI